VSSIQEEVHRFAISYHKSKHTQNTIKTAMTQIEGIGDKKASNLLVHFKTIAKIKNATPEDLGRVPGISKKDAQRIYEHFKR
jgi:excinuclease ABC subunit C